MEIHAYMLMEYVMITIIVLMLPLQVSLSANHSLLNVFQLLQHVEPSHYVINTMILIHVQMVLIILNVGGNQMVNVRNSQLAVMLLELL